MSELGKRQESGEEKEEDIHENLFSDKEEQDQLLWNIIRAYTRDTPNYLVNHHIESYNDFFRNGIFQIFRDKNTLEWKSVYDKTLDIYRHQCIFYFGGKGNENETLPEHPHIAQTKKTYKRGEKLYFGKPMIRDNDRSHYMYPNEARLRDMTYAMTIHYDIDVEFIDYLEENEPLKPLLEENWIEIDGIITPIDKEQIIGGGGEEGRDKDKEQEQEPTSYKSQQNQQQKHQQQQQNQQQKRELSIAEKEVILGGAPKQQVRKPAPLQRLRKQIRRKVIPKIYLGKFPIMVQSDLCILGGLPREMRYSLGECKNDQGGYFIIQGKEKTVISQEKFADNMLYVHDYKAFDSEFTHSADIRSVSENVSKPIRTLGVRIVRPTSTYTNENIVVDLPNVTKPVPLFIVFRALGILSDKEIIQYCLLDMDKYAHMLDFFIPSVHDSQEVYTQRNALYYISQLLLKQRTIPKTMEILVDYFLPHIGELNFREKALYLGQMVFRLLSVKLGMEVVTDRDNFKYKRIDTTGTLISELFREYYNIQQNTIHKKFEAQYKVYHKEGLETNLYKLVFDNQEQIFKENRVMDKGFQRAFKGNWGAQAHTKRIGVIQDLNRLSFNSAMSHMRKTNVPIDSSAKVVGPRLLHTSQWGYIDPIDTPDGASIGIHKTLAITAHITKGGSREPILRWLREKAGMTILTDCSIDMLAKMTKVFVNGFWAGSIHNPTEVVEQLRIYRRNGLMSTFISATFDIARNTVIIYTDAGRLCRPIFYTDLKNGNVSVSAKRIQSTILKGNVTWTQLTTGIHERRQPLSETRIYNHEDVFPASMNLEKNQAVVDYIDTSESENAMISTSIDHISSLSKRDARTITHIEIHESLMFGVMSNLIVFPENNPLARNSFSCGQSRQAVSLYHTNYQNRMDKTAVILNSGQTPLVQTRFLDMVNHRENVYGQNAIVAIMCYTGYNVEDAILINEGSLHRGLFRTTYFNTYHAFETKEKGPEKGADSVFSNILSLNANVADGGGSVIRTKPGYDYGYLDKHGIIKEGTVMNDKIVMIGMTSSTRADQSVTCKKGQVGVVDKTFITEGEEGNRIAKIRIREERIPAMGDKFASRNGQKGTIGLIIPEKDMPFTKDGLRPDMIINPHAIPTRMTIGQLIEAIVGKACLIYGAFGDCTAFNVKGKKVAAYGEHLLKMGYHSSGSDILYNGMTGEQLESEIFIGPTYYMRLKHMVKDKINYRAAGPNTALTRQPVSGRANDGGLRIGEMERDSLISHGISNFLNESMMDRADKYYMAVCNTTGMVAVYNSAKNLFFSPMADGPIQYAGSLVDSQDIRIRHVTKFGRSFSIVCIPYSFKLLIQELQAMNIQLRIITEDNLPQLESLSFSTKNISKLLRVPDTTPMTDLIELTGKIVSKTNVLQNKIHKPFESEDEDVLRVHIPTKQPVPIIPVQGSPEFATGSPAYNPEKGSPVQGSPDFATGSPAYNPEKGSPNFATGSPDFATGSPAYNPEKGFPVQGSPDFATGSPAYNPEKDSPLNGGQSNGGQEQEYFTKGDKVFLRGGASKDSKPNRIWNVENIGNKFITITTQDLTELNADDSIQVVNPIDIYKIENGYHTNSFLNPPEYLPEQQPQPQQSPNGVYFNPTIIIQGDNSKNEMPASDQPHEKKGGDIREENATPTIQESVSEPIDFTKNLIIKKM